MGISIKGRSVMANKNSNEVTGWVGWIFFAGFMMILTGSFKAIWGVVALFNSDWLVAHNGELLYLDLTSWGWWQLILGLVMLFAGFAVMQGATWARVVGVIAATVSAITQLVIADQHPLWSIMIVVVDVLVIYALTVHGDELEDLE